MNKVEIARVEDLPTGTMKGIKVNGKRLVLYHLNDGFYATQGLCTHTLGPLARGKIFEDGIVQCPLHRARFNIRTGEVEQWANFPPGVQLINKVRKEKALTTYPVRVEEGNVYVEMD